MKYFIILVLLLGACTFQRPDPMYVVEKIDYVHHVYHVRLRDDLVSGSGGASLAAGVVINFILERDPAWRVYITNDWVPSKLNPVDLDWSRELAKGY